MQSSASGSAARRRRRFPAGLSANSYMETLSPCGGGAGVCRLPRTAAAPSRYAARSAALGSAQNVSPPAWCLFPSFLPTPDRFRTVLACFGCLHLYYSKNLVKINQLRSFSITKNFHHFCAEFPAPWIQELFARKKTTALVYAVVFSAFL